MSACILWEGPTSPNGYGHRQIGGKTVSVHRLAWEEARGPIPAGMIVRHKCDIRACINAEHLELGSHLDNMRDRNERGRQARGESQGHALLTEAEVCAIRERYRSGERQTALALEYGVHQTTVSDIVRRKSWQHISTESDNAA